MALKRPKWAGGAHPTLQGWVSPTGELLKKQKITQAQIDEWYGVSEEPVVQTLHEAPVVEEQLVSQETYSYYSGGSVEEHHEEHIEEQHGEEHHSEWEE